MEAVFFNDVISQKMHDVLVKNYNFTEEELDVLDYETIPELLPHIDLECIKIHDIKGKDNKSIGAYKEKQFMRKIIKKLHYAVWDLTEGGICIDK